MTLNEVYDGFENQKNDPVHQLDKLNQSHLMLINARFSKKSTQYAQIPQLDIKNTTHHWHKHLLFNWLGRYGVEGNQH